MHSNTTAQVMWDTSSNKVFRSCSKQLEEVDRLVYHSNVCGCQVMCVCVFYILSSLQPEQRNTHPQVQPLQAVQLVSRAQRHRRAAVAAQLQTGLQPHACVVLQPQAAVKAQHLGTANKQHIKQQWEAGAAQRLASFIAVLADHIHCTHNMHTGGRRTTCLAPLTMQRIRDGGRQMRQSCRDAAVAALSETGPKLMNVCGAR